MSLSAAFLLRFCFLALLVKFLKEIVFTDFLDSHIQGAARHLLDVFQDHRIVKSFFIPVAIKCFHQLAKVNNGILAFLGIFFLKGFLHELLDVLAVVLEAHLALRVINSLWFLEEYFPRGNGVRTVDVEVEVCNDI